MEEVKIIETTEQEKEKKKRIPKFSYSKLSVYEQCPFKYKLIYKDKNFINQPSIAADFGTLVHFIEETMAKTITSYQPLNYEYLIDLFINAEIVQEEETKNEVDESTNEQVKEEKKEAKYIYGIKKLNELYPKEFYEKDKHNKTYEDKAYEYINNGIYRLKDFLISNPDLDIIGIEQPFELEYNGILFHGFIDRVFRDVNTGTIIVEDIKTYSAPLEAKDLTTPLQFVMYTLAARHLYGTDDIKCYYDLPLLNIKQEAGTKGYVNRGIKKLDKLLSSISEKIYEPKPCPLCHWCVFSETYPNQPEKAKNLCPYFSKWTKDNKDFTAYYNWAGLDNHEKILESFINKEHEQKAIKVKIEQPIPTNTSERRFIFRF